MFLRYLNINLSILLSKVLIFQNKKFIMNQRKVWDAIAESWYNFRQRPFPDFEEIAKRVKLPKKAKILDVGCGNCRNLLPFRGHDLYALDFSEEMLRFARSYCDKHGIDAKLAQGDCTALPFRNNAFDLVLCIAVLHHLSNPLIALMEVNRVLKSGGVLIASVWNKWQPRFLWAVITGKKEVFVPWRRGSKVYQRYYRLISKQDLDLMLRMAGFRDVEVFYGTKKGLFYQNIFAIAKK